MRQVWSQLRGMQIIVEDVDRQVAEAVVSIAHHLGYTVRAKPRGEQLVVRIVRPIAHPVISGIFDSISMLSPSLCEGLSLDRSGSLASSVPCSHQQMVVSDGVLHERRR